MIFLRLMGYNSLSRVRKPRVKLDHRFIGQLKPHGRGKGGRKVDWEKRRRRHYCVDIVRRNKIRFERQAYFILCGLLCDHKMSNQSKITN